MKRLKETITLTNLKHNKSRSQETHCFTATINVDGKVLCKVINDGFGGCDMYESIGKQTHNDLHKEIAKIDAELGKETIQEHGFEIANSLEIVVGELVNDMLVEKEVKSLIRRRICYTTADGGIYELPAKHKPTPANIEAVSKAPWWKSTNTFIKDMPMNEAVALMRAS